MKFDGDDNENNNNGSDDDDDDDDVTPGQQTGAAEAEVLGTAGLGVHRRRSSHTHSGCGHQDPGLLPGLQRGVEQSVWIVKCCIVVRV